MKTIQEGLRKNDLRGMMENTISVDEYESKIDDSAIVIAFYAATKDVAEDANRFVQKSFVELLDTEVSAAPDQKGFYLLFVEMMLNDKTAKGISDLCQELSSLTGITNWELRVRGEDESQIVSPEEMKEILTGKLKELLKTMFSDSNVDDVKVDETCMEAFSGQRSMQFIITDMGKYDAVYARNQLSEAAIDLSSSAERGNRIIKSFLGPQWNVERLGSNFAAHNQNTNSLILLTFPTL